MSFSSGGDAVAETDKFVSDGFHWFIHSMTRGFAKGTKDSSTGEFECEAVHDEVKYDDDMSLFVMEDGLYVRSQKHPDQPFLELDKNTLKPKDQQIVYTGDGVDKLKWTPEGRDTS